MLFDAIKKWENLLLVFEDLENLGYFSDVRKLNKNIEKAIELDETQLTAIMILKNSLKDYVKEKEFSMDFLLENRLKLFDFLNNYDDMVKYLSNKGCTEPIKEFQNKIINGLINSKLDVSESLLEIINNEYELAVIRLSALRAFKNLRVDQFKSGKVNGNVVNFHKEIFRFADMNHLLKQAISISNGVYVCFIEDATYFQFSFFIFLIKNGDNIWIVSDKPDLPQPNYRIMSRSKSKERSFEARIFSNLFPYELFVHYDETMSKFVEGKQINTEEYQTSIVKKENDFWGVLGVLDECQSDTQLWIYMMISLFQQKFFIQETPKLPLSYTMEMVQEETEDTTALAQIGYESLIIKHVDTVNVKTDDVKWETNPVGHNQWLLDRYGKDVKNYSSKTLMAAPGETKEISANNFSLVSNRPEGNWLDTIKTEMLSVANVRRDDFGTIDEVKNNLAFQARYSQVNMIQALNHKEYKERNKELTKWFRNAIEKNITNIEKAIGKEEFLTVKNLYVSNFKHGEKDSKIKNVMTIIEKDKKGYSGLGMINFFGGNSNYPKCYFTEKAYSLCVDFDINNAQAIADICGIQFKDLPDVLQHFNKVEPYTGNSILYFLDPLDHIKDEFSRRMNFDVRIYLSKRYFNYLTKTHGGSIDK